MLHARRLIELLLISLVAHAVPLAAASLFDPALRFRMLRTEHFVIYFHQGEDRIAGRLAWIAEDTWTTLRRSFGRTPPLRTHVVIADQAESANGYATPLPRDTVVVTAAWPEGVDFIGNTDDWLRMVFTHEFTHIVHLDRSEGWARAVRAVLGRDGLAFPNMLLPPWQIEGLATYEESAVTGFGRLHAGDFRAIVGEQARQESMEPLDRVNGGLIDWPSGLAPYAYGLGFHHYLAERFGHASLGRLADETARRIPYLTGGAFTKVFNESLGSLWRDYKSIAAREAGVPESDPRISRVTHHGFVASGPRFDRFAANSIVYAKRTPHGFPALERVRADGSSSQQIVRRYFGETSTPAPDAVYFDQQEFRRNVGLYSDLYVWSRANGNVTRVTHDARLLDPDLSPDGTTIACVQQKPGQRDLVLVRVNADATNRSEIATLIAEPDTQFNGPRWSPDGRSIAVERHRPGELSQVIIVDVAAKTVRTLVWDGPARMVTPAWRPDGQALLVAVAPEERTFNLFEYRMDASAAPQQVTRTTGGAMWPDVSADGRTIAFVGYTVDGFDLFTMPYPAESERRADTQTIANDQPPAAALPASSISSAKPYSPFPTLWPTSWVPAYETDGGRQVRLGAAVFGSDVLGYHYYEASATWLASGPEGTPKPPASRPDWNLYYAYTRWRPVFWATTESSTTFFAGPASATGEPLPVTLRQLQLEGGVLFPIVHARTSHQALFSVLRSKDEFTDLESSGRRDRASVRGGLSTVTAHTYGYSISPEDGIRAGATAELTRQALGSTDDATAVTADVRLYAPLPAAHHVLAVRVAGGASSGDVNTRRNFLLGGAGPNPAVIDFDRDAISLMRGFPANRFAGTHVALMNVDYRFPLARPQRGSGTIPLFLRTFYGAAFADVGHAWTDQFRADAIKVSMGGEFSTDLVFGFFFPITATVGAAWGHDGSGAAPDRTTVYFRVGRAF